MQKSGVDVLRELDAHHQAVAIVIMGDVLAPVDGRNAAAAELELFLFLDDVDDAVPAVDFSRRRDQRDDVVTNLLNERRLFDGKPIEELHQHLRASRFRRVNGAGEPINRLGLVNEARTVALGDALSYFDVVVEDFGNGDRFEVKPIILSHDGHLRTVLLKDQRARRNRHHPGRQNGHRFPQFHRWGVRRAQHRRPWLCRRHQLGGIHADQPPHRPHRRILALYSASFDC